MNSFGRRLVLNTTTKRKMNLLDYLLTGPKSIQETSNELKVSEKTVRRLVSFLEEELPKEIRLDVLRSSVLVLEVSDYFVYSSLMKSWASESPLYNIIETLFYSEHLTIGEYSDHLFLSETTIRTYLKQLETLVDEYKLKLNLSPVVSLVGDEENIRYFYFHFYFYSGELIAENPRHQANAQGIYNYLDYLSMEFQIPLYIDYTRLLIWMFVIETRLSQGNSVVLDEKLIGRHWNTHYFQQFLKAFNLFFSSNEIWKNGSKSELVYAYITRLSTVVYEDGKPYFMGEYIKELENFEVIVSNFLKKFDVNRVVYSEMEFKLKSYLANLFFLSESTTLHQKIVIEPDFPSTYESVYQLWLELLEDSEWAYKKDVALNLTYIVCSSFMKKDYKYKNILFVLTGEPVLIPYYKQLIHRLLPQEANAHYLFNKPISKDLLQALDIDIIISNIALNLNKIQEKQCTLIRLSDNPDEKEWAALVKKLYKV